MQSLLTKIALTDANDLTKNEVISNVSDGLEGATSFGYSVEYEKLTVENAQSLNYKAMHSIEIIGLPVSGVSVSNLEHFADPDVDTLFSAIGTDMGIICQDSVKCEFTERYNDGLAWRFYITFETLPYREESSGRKAGGMHSGENLLEIYPFEDRSGSNISDGYSVSGANTYVFSSGTQTISLADGATDSFSSNMYFFPFVGDEVSAQVQVDAFTISSGTLKITYYDSSGAEISSDTQGFSGTGTHGVTGTIPAGTTHIQFEVDVTATGSSGSIELTNPSLAVGSTPRFTAY